MKFTYLIHHYLLQNQKINFNNTLYLSLLVLIISTKCVPVTSSNSYYGKQLISNDFNYEPFVGMVQLYPNVDKNNNPQLRVNSPMLRLNKEKLTLDFDLLEENYRYIQARYVHCNADWSPSRLQPIQFLDVYNAFALNNYEYSSNTRTPYVHYKETLPTPKIPGNYLLIVYTDNEDDLLLVRRFGVYDTKVKIEAKVLQSNIVSNRSTDQKLQFSTRYSQIQSQNPLQDFKVVILQNHNWNTAKKDLKPTQIKPDQLLMEFYQLTGENDFWGLKEFRFFDMRAVDYRGINVSSIQKTPEKVDVFLNQDKPRRGLAYTQINEDLNGNFYLQNQDPNDIALQSEYATVHFELKSQEITGDVFILGDLSQWTLRPDNQMHYDPASQSYKGSLLLKQGYYNYIYWVRSETLDADYLEGSNFQTQNQYEILVYYNDPAKNFDQLLGYTKFLSRN